MFLIDKSADRDEGWFPSPDKFDLRQDSTRRFAFGTGPHFLTAALGGSGRSSLMHHYRSFWISSKSKPIAFWRTEFLRLGASRSFAIAHFVARTD